MKTLGLIKTEQMIKFLIVVLILITSTSCSMQNLITLIAKTPEIEYVKPLNYEELNKYQKDALYLTELIKSSYPRLESKISEREFYSESQKLINDLSNIEDDFEFEIRIKIFMALLKDGHSKMRVDFSSKSDERFYFSLYKEKDDWIIKNIDRTIDSIVIGSKLISINSIPVDEIEHKISKFESGENSYRTNSKFIYFSSKPKYLKALGILHEDEFLKLTVNNNNIERNITLSAKEKAETYHIVPEKSKYPFTVQQNGGFYYRIDSQQNYAYLQMNTSLDYLSIKSEISNYTNFITRPIALMIMKKQTKDARNFGMVLQSMFYDINENSIDNLIIDLRNNWGGDARLGKQLIWYLTDNQEIKGFTEYLRVTDYFKQQMKTEYKMLNELYMNKCGMPIPKKEINVTTDLYNPAFFYDITKEDSPFLLDSSLQKFKGNVFVLIGERTFSAAQTLATTISDNDLAVLVGVPVGQKPTSQTGTSKLKLPFTKKIVGLSLAYIERPDKSKNNEISLFPHVEIYPTFKDYLSGVDVQFEYILNEKK